MADEIDYGQKMKERLSNISLDDIKNNPINVHLYQLNSILKSIRYSVSELLGEQDKNKDFENVKRLKKLIKEGDSNPFLEDSLWWRAAKDLINLQEMILGLKQKEVESAITTLGSMYFQSSDTKREEKKRGRPKVDFKKMRDSDIPEDFKDDMLPED